MLSLPLTFFVPLAIETPGAIGPKSLLFLKDLGNCLRRESGDSHAAAYLLQRVAVQQGKATSILGGLAE